MAPKLPNLPCFEAFGVIFCPDFCSCFCLVCEDAGGGDHWHISETKPTKSSNRKTPPERSTRKHFFGLRIRQIYTADFLLACQTPSIFCSWTPLIYTLRVEPEGWNPLRGHPGKWDLLGASEWPTLFSRSVENEHRSSKKCCQTTFLVLWPSKILSYKIVW